jgi:hypothetical protein
LIHFQIYTKLTKNHLPINRHCRGRRSHGQAPAEGRPCLPQVQGQAQLMAQGPRCGHEPGGASARRWKPPAHRSSVHREARHQCRSQSGPDRGQTHRTHSGWKAGEAGQGGGRLRRKNNTDMRRSTIDRFCCWTFLICLSSSSCYCSVTTTVLRINIFVVCQIRLFFY